MNSITIDNTNKIITLAGDSSSSSVEVDSTDELTIYSDESFTLDFEAENFTQDVASAIRVVLQWAAEDSSEMEFVSEYLFDLSYKLRDPTAYDYASSIAPGSPLQKIQLSKNIFDLPDGINSNLHRLLIVTIQFNNLTSIVYKINIKLQLASTYDSVGSLVPMYAYSDGKKGTINIVSQSLKTGAVMINSIPQEDN